MYAESCYAFSLYVLKSGKPQPIRSPYQNWYTCTAQGPTTFTKFWTGSDKWRQNGGLGRVPNVGFSCKQYQTTFRQQADFRQIWPRHVNREYTSLILPSLILGVTVWVNFAAFLRPVYSDTTQLDVELSCVAINGPLNACSFLVNFLWTSLIFLIKLMLCGDQTGVQYCKKGRKYVDP